MKSARAVLVLSLLGVLVAVGVAVGRLPAEVPRPTPRQAVSAPDVAAAAVEEDPAVAVLRAWDARRARAWRQGDAASLRRLYLPSSIAGRRDLAMLRRWRDRNLVVAGMDTQLLSARVVVRRPRELVVVVSERLVGATAVGRGQRLDLPESTPVDREVTLRRLDLRWRVAAVRAR